MIALTMSSARSVYAPTIPLIWAIFADVADYSEWKTGRRFTGMVFATIGFALKAGLASVRPSFLWIMAGFFNYDTKLPSAPDAVPATACPAALLWGFSFIGGLVSVAMCGLGKQTTLNMAAELAQRRRAASPASSPTLNSELK